MPSRDQRRSTQKKSESASDSIEKRRSMHPALYIGTIAILVVTVVTFILAGPGGPMTRGSGSSRGNVIFGSYKGRDIVYTAGGYFAQQYDSIKSQVQQQNGGSISDSSSQAIWYQAFINTAEHFAIVDQATSSGVIVSDDAVDKKLLTYPAYLDENGKFSESRYTAATAAEKAATRSLVRENMESDIFVSDVLYGVKDGSKEVDFIKSMVKPERSFSFVSFPFTNFPAEEVRTYGEANKSKFVKIKVSRILVKSSESQATEIRKKIAGKTSTFEELAKSYSKDVYADKGGDMGWRYAYDLQADFDVKDTAQKVLALKAGEISEVLKGTFGWMIYRCDGEAVDADFKDATVQQDVRTYITTYEKGKIEDYFTTRAGQLTQRAGEIGFDRAVAAMNLKAVPTAFFPVNYNNVFSFAPLAAKNSADTPTNAQYSEDFFIKGFSLAADQVSAPVVLDDQVMVLRLIGQQDLPATTLNLLGSWVTYVANQSVQSDLASALMTPVNLKDDFAATYNTYVAPSTAKQ
jgi:parvulin-like peptidyl-prolyl isomerase